MADCAKCGAYFWRDEANEPWKRLCLSCWKAERGIADAPPPKPKPRKDSSAEIARLRAQISMLETQLFIARNSRPTVSNGNVDQAMLKKMRMLCHPDKHGNSAIATEVTQYLNNKLK